jgi:hypothetical protein
MNMRMILASNDPVSIDGIAALLEGHDPLLVPHLVTVHNDSAGCVDPRLIRVNGIKVGDEKKDFEINDSGNLSKYSDFEPPVFSIDACSIANNQLCLNLTTDDEVTKVEITIDGNYLNQIRINNFDAFCLDLDTFQVDYNTEIMIYAYDKYLNYSKQQAQLHVMTPEKKTKNRIKFYPNPVKNYSKLRIENEYFGDVYVSIFDSHGKLITSYDFYKKGLKMEEVIDLNHLSNGSYTLLINYKGKSESINFIKVK